VFTRSVAGRGVLTSDVVSTRLHRRAVARENAASRGLARRAVLNRGVLTGSRLTNWILLMTMYTVILEADFANHVDDLLLMTLTGKSFAEFRSI